MAGWEAGAGQVWWKNLVIKEGLSVGLARLLRWTEWRKAGKKGEKETESLLVS